MQLERASAELLFRVICSRYENGSIILTSNKYFGDWGELMNDTAITTAILDRLLHHSHIINIRGESYRLKVRLKGGVRVVLPADISVRRWHIKQSFLEGRIYTGIDCLNSAALAWLDREGTGRFIL